MIDLRLGDCLDIMRGLPDGCVDAVITSPPYFNLRVYSQWETYSDHLADVDKWLSECSRVLKDGRHICWNIQHFLPDKLNGERYHLPLSADTEKIAYRHNLMLEQNVTWHKPNGKNQRMFGSYPYPPTIIYTPNKEDVLIFRKVGKANLSNKNDASRLTEDEWAKWSLPIWSIAVDYVNRGHPAHFPVELPSRCLRLHSFAGDTVLDPFMGSGTTGVACVKLNRSFIGIEINERYYNIAKKRIAEAQQQMVLL